ncbi:MAG: hypothetical protein GXY61_08015 [Lentisphaerae bacterium]|nr:hypothetical protein [Lentisphaerota bacterium]
MPAYYTVDTDLKVVFVIHLGNVDDKEALAENEKLGSDPLITPELSYFVDLREAKSEMRTTAMLHRLAEQAKQWRGDSSSGSRVAILVARDISFGLARMFEVYTDVDENNFRVFREIHEAADWLGIPVSAVEKVRASINQ